MEAKIAKDNHSFAEPEKARVDHLDLTLEVNFEKKILHGTAKFSIYKSKDAVEIIFDTEIVGR